MHGNSNMLEKLHPPQDIPISSPINFYWLKRPICNTINDGYVVIHSTSVGQDYERVIDGTRQWPLQNVEEEWMQYSLRREISPTITHTKEWDRPFISSQPNTFTKTLGNWKYFLNHVLHVGGMDRQVGGHL